MNDESFFFSLTIEEIFERKRKFPCISWCPLECWISDSIKHMCTIWTTWIEWFYTEMDGLLHIHTEYSWECSGSDMAWVMYNRKWMTILYSKSSQEEIITIPNKGKKRMRNFIIDWMNILIIVIIIILYDVISFDKQSVSMKYRWWPLLTKRSLKFTFDFIELI